MSERITHDDVSHSWCYKMMMTMMTMIIILSKQLQTAGFNMRKLQNAVTADR